MFDQVMVAVLLFQLVMLALLGIKRAVVPPLLVAPLPFLSLLFWWACRALFLRPQRTLALADAAQLDRQEADRGGTWGQDCTAGGEAGAEGLERGGQAGEGAAEEAGGKSWCGDAQGAGTAGAIGHRHATAAGLLRRGSSVEERRMAARSLYLSPSFQLDEQELAGTLFELDSMLHWLHSGGAAGGGGGAAKPEVRGWVGGCWAGVPARGRGCSPVCLGVCPCLVVRAAGIRCGGAAMVMGHPPLWSLVGSEQKWVELKAHEMVAAAWLLWHDLACRT